MALGLFANINSPDVRSPGVSAATIMTASFTKLVETPVAALQEEQPVVTNTSASRAQMRPYIIAERAAFGAISMASTAQEALGEAAHLLDGMRNVIARAAETPEEGALASAQSEYSKLHAELRSLVADTRYNGVDLLGPDAKPVTFDLGPAGESESHVQVNFSEFVLDLPTPSSVGSREAGVMERSLASVDRALTTAVTQRTELGAALRKIETATQMVQTRRLNSAAANSRVRDVAVAEEMARLSGDLVVRQPGVSVLGQGEQLQQISMSLLR